MIRVLLRFVYVALWPVALVLGMLLGVPADAAWWALTGSSPEFGPLCLVEAYASLGEWLSRPHSGDA